MNHEQHHEDLPDLAEIMQAFGVTTWENLGPLDAMPEQGLHLLLEIEGQKYILRERPEGLLGTDLSHRYDFQQHLRQVGIPVPLFKQTPQGESAVFSGEDAFELHVWPGGGAFETTDAHSLTWVEHAGTMLGRIHQASRQYQGSVHCWPSEAHIGGIVQNYLHLARARADENPLQAIAAGLSEWADQWETILPSAMMSIGSGRNLPEFHIHGDYHARNLRFNDSGVTAVMGLEAYRWEKRLFEVAYALFAFSAFKWQSDSSSTSPLVLRGFEPERMQHFLAAYGALCPPMPGEAALLADALLLMGPVVTANGPLGDLFYTQEEPDALLIDTIMAHLAWATSLPAWLARMRRALPDIWR